MTTTTALEARAREAADWLETLSDHLARHTDPGKAAWHLLAGHDHTAGEDPETQHAALHQADLNAANVALHLAQEALYNAQGNPLAGLVSAFDAEARRIEQT